MKKAGGSRPRNPPRLSPYADFATVSTGTARMTLWPMAR
jgi:hypothetical protein